MSWHPTIATTRLPNLIDCIVWSPCSRFIAISLKSVQGIQILDAVTLKQLKLFTPLHHTTQALAFSPESHLLTWFGNSNAFITWDLQTGVQIGEIPIEGELNLEFNLEEGSNLEEFVEDEMDPCVTSITYSECGTMFGALFKDSYTTAIGTYNVLSSVRISYHLIKGKGPYEIWTHDDCIWYPTYGVESIAIWGIGFTSEHPPSEVRIMPTPNNFSALKQNLFIPTPSQLAFILEDNETLLVWDLQHSKVLLNSTDVEIFGEMTFSSDGQFFATGNDRLIYLWKGSPAGYTLHQKLTSGTNVTRFSNLLLSPSGQSIIASDTITLHLWNTMDPTIPPSHVPAFQKATYFILEFSPDRSLAVTAKLQHDSVTVFDLKSGATQFVIDTGMEIYGLGVAGGTVVVVGDGKVTTWNLPAVGHILNTRLNISDAIKTVKFDHHSAGSRLRQISSASISPNFDYIAVMGKSGRARRKSSWLNIYDLPSGEHLTRAGSEGGTPWFTRDGHEVWCLSSLESKVHEAWVVSKDEEFGITELEHIKEYRGPSGGFPWESPHGCQFTDGGWITSSTGKYLLWLPPDWRSQEGSRVWGGEFLALLHCELSEVVILELLEE